MSVTGRKMFKRDARDKVRQMGGIMASSEPLIQEVARFQYGGGVDFGALEERYTGTPGMRRYRSEVPGPGVKTIFSDQQPIFSSNLHGTIKHRDKYPIPEYKGGILGGEAQSTVQRQGLDRIINKANQLGILDAPTLNKSDVENFIKNETGDDKFKLTSTLWDSLSEDKSPSVSNLEKISKEIFKYTGTPSVAAIDLMGNAINYLRSVPKGTAEKILSGQMSLPSNVDFVSLALASGKTLTQLEALGVPVTEMAAIRKAREKGIGIETKVKIKDDVEEKKALDAEQIAMREAEKKMAVEGGMPLSGQIGGTDKEALQDQLSGGRISSEAPQTLGVTADQGTEYDHKLASDKAKETGDLTDVKKKVQDTVNSGIGTGGALKQLINEFTSNAPEYEGMDRGLAIAKIGFAMAAGKSPNALTNIAEALSQGADMFLKDDEKRRDFKRQIELAGLQYGLGEVSKQRAEGRAQARQDRALKYFVAGKEMIFDGVKYGKDDIVAVPEGYIRQAGVPPGLTTENLVKGALTNKIKIEELLAKAKKENRMTDKDYRENRKVVTDATLDFEKSRNLTTLLEGQIFQVAKGNVTGVTAFANDLINKAANTAGIDMGFKYETLERYDADMRKVANQLIKDLLGEGSKNISNVDRQLASEIVGLFTTGASGILGGYIYRDDDVLLSRLQGIHQTMQNTQRGALADINDVLQLSYGRQFMSGAPVTYSRITDTALSALEQGKREYDPTTRTIKVTGGSQEGIIRLSDLLTDGIIDSEKVGTLFGGV